MRPREGLLFYVFLLVFFLSLAALSVFLLSGERKRGALLVEYESEKLATALLDNLRENRSLDLPELRGRVLGFGVYTAGGEALQRFGTAPELLEDPQSPGVRPQRSSLVLVRFLGLPPGMMGRMWGGPHRRGEGPGQGPGRGSPQMMGPLAPLPAGAPRVLFLELAAGRYLARQRVFRLAQAVVPLALAALGALVAAQYRRNSEYRRRLSAQTELARLGEISRTLSHEIKNPLSAIRLQTGLLKKTLPEERHGDLRIIEEEIQRLALLTERVGDFLRDPRGAPQELDLDLFLRELALRYDGRLRYRLEGWAGAGAGGPAAAALRDGEPDQQRAGKRGGGGGGELRRASATGPRSAYWTAARASRRRSAPRCSIPSSPARPRARASGWPWPAASWRPPGGSWSWRTGPAAARWPGSCCPGRPSEGPGRRRREEHPRIRGALPAPGRPGDGGRGERPVGAAPAVRAGLRRGDRGPAHAGTGRPGPAGLAEGAGAARAGDHDLRLRRDPRRGGGHEAGRPGLRGQALRPGGAGGAPQARPGKPPPGGGGGAGRRSGRPGGAGGLSRDARDPRHGGEGGRHPFHRADHRRERHRQGGDRAV